MDDEIIVIEDDEPKDQPSDQNNKPAKRTRMILLDSSPEIERKRVRKQPIAPNSAGKRFVPFLDDDDDWFEKNTDFARMPGDQTTLKTEQEERERIKRLAEKQAKYNSIILDESSENLEQALNDSFNSQIPKAKSLILENYDGKEVAVHPSIVRHLKPHQLTGIQFLYNCTIESVNLLDGPGSGGILAHCMGLGKTLQVIAFLHTILIDPVVSKTIRHVMVVCPKNVVLNWKNEFNKWLERDRSIPRLEVFELDSVKTYDARAGCLRTWFNSRKSGVMIIGYEMYRDLVKDYSVPNKKTGKPPKTSKKLLDLQEKFREYLQDPGPDMIVCDEGHKLKNGKAAITMTINQVRTKRRICLTGTPLQNDLEEYYTMVNFVKPGLLGTPDEFNKRFKRPIKAGQTKDADDFDVVQMRRRCHVLFTTLRGVIDRRDFSVLKESLLPKLEYVISVRLTEKQIKLYQLYLNTKNEGSNGIKLLADYHMFARIFSHPYQLIVHQEEKALKDAKKIDEIVIGDSESDNEGAHNNGTAWFENSGILQEEDRLDFTLSYKLMIIIEILKECESVGDKVLIFSQSLETLRMICRMLKFLDKDWFADEHEAVLKPPNAKWGWKQDRDYMLITGSVSSKDRDSIQKQFNSQNSARIRLCLISTKAGSLGTNFVAANRVIIMDQNWNPSHDRQAMFRAYRFGQTKPVYVYRLVAFGTIEERIYARQVTKESIAGRVLDENQIKRHYTNSELAELYKLEVVEYDSSKPPLYAPPEDELLACVFSKLKEGVVNCIQHDSLLAHVEGEDLTAEERKKAWDEFSKNINDRKHARAAARVHLLDNERTQPTTSLANDSPADNLEDYNPADFSANDNPVNDDDMPNPDALDAYEPEALNELAKILGIHPNDIH